MCILCTYICHITCVRFPTKSIDDLDTEISDFFRDSCRAGLRDFSISHYDKGVLQYGNVTNLGEKASLRD